jgi:hypothetical protein
MEMRMPGSGVYSELLAVTRNKQIIPGHHQEGAVAMATSLNLIPRWLSIIAVLLIVGCSGGGGSGSGSGSGTTVNNPSSPSSDAPAPTSSLPPPPPPPPAPSAVVSVFNTGDWQDTRLTVRAGDVVTIITVPSDSRQPDSRILAAGRASVAASPDEDDTCRFLVCGDAIPAQALVGMIESRESNDGTTGFLVGSSFSQTVTESGSLLLGFNGHESETTKKGEPLTVLITVTPR